MSNAVILLILILKAGVIDKRQIDGPTSRTDEAKTPKTAGNSEETGWFGRKKQPIFVAIRRRTMERRGRTAWGRREKAAIGGFGDAQHAGVCCFCIALGSWLLVSCYGIT